MTIDGVFQNRKVVSQEKITTVAGIFDCFKIEYESSKNMHGVNMVHKSEEWFSPKLGFLVRSNTYGPDEKLLSYMELTKLVTQ